MTTTYRAEFEWPIEDNRASLADLKAEALERAFEWLERHRVRPVTAPTLHVRHGVKPTLALTLHAAGAAHGTIAGKA